ncbi:MAG: hypothetical protein JNL58_04135 [Planctomyces sp.]|nr:hypothetical protein [Planctomyces sp.]
MDDKKTGCRLAAMLAKASGNFDGKGPSAETDILGRKLPALEAVGVEGGTRNELGGGITHEARNAGNAAGFSFLHSPWQANCNNRMTHYDTK